MKPLTKHDVSVIIPVHNREGQILKCLRSIPKASESHSLISQIIVVDDGSTDSTIQIVSEEEGNDPRIELHCQAAHGAASARNEGLKHVKCPWVLFVDSDDYLTEDALHVLQSGFDSISRETEIIAFDFFTTLDGHKLSYQSNSHFKRNIWTSADRMQMERLCVCNIDFDGTPKTGMFGALWGKLYSTRFLHECVVEDGRFLDEGMSRSEDILFNIRALARVRKIVHAKAACYVYNLNPSSTTHAVKGESAFRAEISSYLMGLKSELSKLTFRDKEQLLYQAAFTGLYEDSLRNSRSVMCIDRSVKDLIRSNSIYKSAISSLSPKMLTPAGKVRLMLLRSRLIFCYSAFIKLLTWLRPSTLQAL